MKDLRGNESISVKGVNTLKIGKAMIVILGKEDNSLIVLHKMGYCLLLRNFVIFVN